MIISFRNKIISIIFKLIVIIPAVIGIILSCIGRQKAFMSGSTVFMYFTIQSNILIALICLVGILFLIKNFNSRIWGIIKLSGTVAITVTGVVFCFVLAPTLGNYAWSTSNILTHVVVPLAAIADYYVVCHSFDYKKKDVLYVLICPILYVIYASIGYLAKWDFASGNNYPYFFLNWGSKAGAFGFSSELPYIGVAWWIILILLFLLGVGFVYIISAKKIKNRYQ